MKLDILDMNILRILQEDARKPVLEIAKELKTSRPTIKSRIEKLRKIGIIKKFTAIIDRDAILENVISLFFIKTHNPEDISEKLSKKHEIIEVYSTMGSRNVVCKAIARNINELKNLISEMEKIDGITDIETFIVMKSIKEEYETKIGPEIGVKTECETCGNVMTDNIITFKTHNKEYYFCCPVCLKKFKEK